MNGRRRTAFTDEEKAAMRELVKERKANSNKATAEAACPTLSPGRA